MSAYVIQRILLILLTLLGMSIIIFVLLRLVPGNIVDIMFDSAGFVDPSEKASIEKELGLDLPIYQQYFDWITALLVGDLGFSFVSEMPAIDEIGPRIPITAKFVTSFPYSFSILFVSVGCHQCGSTEHHPRLRFACDQFEWSISPFLLVWLCLFLWLAFPMGAIPIYTETPKHYGMSYYCIFCLRNAVGFRASALIMRLTRSSML